MAKDIKYGLSFWGKDRGATKLVKKLRGQVQGLNRDARGRWLVGSGKGGGLFGMLGAGLPGMGLLKGGLGLGTKLFSGVLSAAKSVVSGVLSVFTGMVTGVVRLISGMVKIVGGLMGGILRKVKTIGMIAGATFVAGMAFSIKQAASLEDAMAEVATMADWTAAEFKRASDEILRVSVKVGRSAVELTGGVYQAVSAGATSVEGALTAMRLMAETAVAGGADMETTMRLLMGSMNAYGLQIEDLGKISDTFFEGIRLGVFRFEDLADVIGPVSAVAGNFGLRLDQVVAAMSALTAGGVPTARAGTSLRAMIDVMAELPHGFERFRRLGLRGFIEQLRAQTKGVPEAIKKIFPDKRTSLAAQVLIGKMFDKFQEFAEQTENATGAMTRAFIKRMNTLSKRIDQLWQQVKKIGIRIGEPFLEPLKKLADQFREMFDSIESDLVAFSTKMRDSILDVIEFFSDRTWQWDNIKRGAQRMVQELSFMAADIGALFVFKVPELGLDEPAHWQMGPVIKGILALFEWLMDQIRGLFQILWIQVGRDLTAAAGSWLANLGADIATAAADAMRAQVAKAWDQPEGFWDRIDKPILQRGKAWADLTAQQQADAEAKWQKRHAIARQQYEMPIRLGARMAEIGGAMPGRLTTEEEAEATARERQELRESTDRLKETMDGLRTDIQSQMRGARPGGAAREIFEEMVPKIIAPEAAGPAVPTVGEQKLSGMAASLQKAINRRLAVEQLLVRDIEKAEAQGDSEASVARLLERLHTYMAQTARVQQRFTNMMENAADSIESLEQNQQDLDSRTSRIERRVNRLATARA